MVLPLWAWDIPVRDMLEILFSPKQINHASAKDYILCKTDESGWTHTHDIQICLFGLYAQGDSCCISGLVNSWKSSRLPQTYGQRTISYVFCITRRIQLRCSVRWDIWTLGPVRQNGGWDWGLAPLGICLSMLLSISSATSHYFQ